MKSEKDSTLKKEAVQYREQLDRLQKNSQLEAKKLRESIKAHSVTIERLEGLLKVAESKQSSAVEENRVLKEEHYKMIHNVRTENTYLQEAVVLLRSQVENKNMLVEEVRC